MSDVLLAEEFDLSVSRLLSGAPVSTVVSSAPAETRPYLEAFAHILHAQAVARPGFEEQLRARLIAKYGKSSQRGNAWVPGFRKAAAATAAALLLGGAINPTLAASLHASVREAFGESVAQVFEDLLSDVVSVGSQLGASSGGQSGTPLPVEAPAEDRAEIANDHQSESFGGFIGTSFADAALDDGQSALFAAPVTPADGPEAAPPTTFVAERPLPHATVPTPGAGSPASIQQPESTSFVKSTEPSVTAGHSGDNGPAQPTKPTAPDGSTVPGNGPAIVEPPAGQPDEVPVAPGQDTAGANPGGGEAPTHGNGPTNPGNGGNPPGQSNDGGTNPGNGGTAPGQGELATNPGNGGGPPGQVNGGPNPGNGGNPPGQGEVETNPGNGGVPPGQVKDRTNQGNGGNPPGQSKDEGASPGNSDGGGAPGHGNGPTNPGKGHGENPGQGRDPAPPADPADASPSLSATDEVFVSALAEEPDTAQAAAQVEVAPNEPRGSAREVRAALKGPAPDTAGRTIPAQRSTD